MIPLFDLCVLSTDDVPMGYSKHTTSIKIECVRRYFSEASISIRKLAEEQGVNFSTLSHWIKMARKAGLLNPG
ncbi:MAG: transposase [Bacteroidales bacterium]|nr:transposase [Bacteroidales bacterium]